MHHLRDTDGSPGAGNVDDDEPSSSAAMKM
jgi:hypothetical protein